MPRISTAALFGPLPKSKTKSKALAPEPDDESESDEMSPDETDDPDDEPDEDGLEHGTKPSEDDSHEKTLGDELIKAYRSGDGLGVYEAIRAIVDSSSDGV